MQVSTRELLGRTIPTGAKVGGGQQVLFKDFDRDWVVWSGKAPWPSAAATLAHALSELAQEAGP